VTRDNCIWTFEPDGAGRGRVRHHTPPRFTAVWSSGAVIDGPSWSGSGSGSGEDGLHFFAFQWRDSAPEPAVFEALMREACAALDAWIAERL
jgi:hypothetical protein